MDMHAALDFLHVCLRHGAACEGHADAMARLLPVANLAIDMSYALAAGTTDCWCISAPLAIIAAAGWYVAIRVLSGILTRAASEMHRLNGVQARQAAV